MKRVLIAALLTSSAVAQSVKEPEFADVFYALSDSKLVNLERQESGGRVRAGLMSAKAGLEFAGANSPVRLQGGHPLEFVVRLPDSSRTDPASLYHVRRLQSKKKSREVVLGTASLFGAKASAGSLIPMEFSKYGEASVKLTIASLAPGEYAVGRQNGRVVFCFGVD
jgi:hypothetical protein